MPNTFYGCFRHETCGGEDCSKTKNFEQKKKKRKRHCMLLRDELLNIINDDPDVLKNGTKHYWQLNDRWQLLVLLGHKF